MNKIEKQVLVLIALIVLTVITMNVIEPKQQEPAIEVNSPITKPEPIELCSCDLCLINREKRRRMIHAGCQLCSQELATRVATLASGMKKQLCEGCCTAASTTTEMTAIAQKRLREQLKAEQRDWHISPDNED